MFVLEAPGAKIITEPFLFCESATILWQFVDTFRVASIKKGASNKDIAVWISRRMA